MKIENWDLLGVLTGYNLADISVSRYYSFPRCSGLVIKCSNVYNVCPGKVVCVGQYNGYYDVSVMVNYTQMIRYCNLLSVSCKLNDVLSIRDPVGTCKDNTRFEYCTQDKGNSDWAVRVGSSCWYKQNPELLMQKDPILIITIEDDTAGQTYSYVDISKSTDYEFTGSKGD